MPPSSPPVASDFSISSIHSTHGATASVIRSACRSRASDSPTSDPNSAPTSSRSSGSRHSPPIIFAVRLLPVPGMPISAMPFGAGSPNRAASSPNARSRSASHSFSALQAADVVGRLVGAVELQGLRLADDGLLLLQHGGDVLLVQHPVARRSPWRSPARLRGGQAQRRLRQPGAAVVGQVALDPRLLDERVEVGAQLPQGRRRHVDDDHVVLQFRGHVGGVGRDDQRRVRGHQGVGEVAQLPLDGGAAVPELVEVLQDVEVLAVRVAPRHLGDLVEGGVGRRGGGHRTAVPGRHALRDVPHDQVGAGGGVPADPHLVEDLQRPPLLHGHQHDHRHPRPQVQVQIVVDAHRPPHACIPVTVTVPSAEITTSPSGTAARSSSR